MRRFLCLVLFAACMPLAVRAQLLHVGLRSGVNVSDVSVERFALADAVVSSGRIKAGYQFAFMARTNLTRHLHLQAEIEYACGVNAYRIDRMTSARSISIRSRRLNLPLELGVQLGAARLFAGASFVIGDWTGNSDVRRGASALSYGVAPCALPHRRCREEHGYPPQHAVEPVVRNLLLADIFEAGV